MKTNIQIKLDGQFETFSNVKLVADDVQAYQVIFETDKDLAGAIFNITATRADGIVISDVGAVTGSTGIYTLVNNMYNVVGKVKLRLTIAQNGSVLTSKEIECNCIKGNGTPDVIGDDRVPALTSLIIQATTSANYANVQGDYAKEQGDIIATFEAVVKSKTSTPRNSTFTICAIDTVSKEAADYICSDTVGNRFNDIIDKIMLALSLDPLLQGSKIFVRNGTYFTNGDINITQKCILEFEDEFDTSAEQAQTAIWNFTGSNISVYNGKLKGFINTIGQNNIFTNCDCNNNVTIGNEVSFRGNDTKMISCRITTGDIVIGNASTVVGMSSRGVSLLNCYLVSGNIQIYGTKSRVKSCHLNTPTAQIQVLNAGTECYLSGNSKVIDIDTNIPLYNNEALAMAYCDLTQQASYVTISSPRAGRQAFNYTTNKPVWYSGTAWIYADGSLA